MSDDLVRVMALQRKEDVLRAIWTAIGLIQMSRGAHPLITLQWIEKLEVVSNEVISEFWATFKINE